MQKASGRGTASHRIEGYALSIWRWTRQLASRARPSPNHRPGRVQTHKAGRAFPSPATPRCQARLSIFRFALSMQRCSKKRAKRSWFHQRCTSHPRSKQSLRATHGRVSRASLARCFCCLDPARCLLSASSGRAPAAEIAWPQFQWRCRTFAGCLRLTSLILASLSAHSRIAQMRRLISFAAEAPADSLPTHPLPSRLLSRPFPGLSV